MYPHAACQGMWDGTARLLSEEDVLQRNFEVDLHAWSFMPNVAPAALPPKHLRKEILLMLALSLALLVPV